MADARAVPAALEGAWARLTAGGPLAQPQTVERMSGPEIDAAMGEPAIAESLAALHGANLLQLARGWYTESMREYVARAMQPAFWRELAEFESVRGTLERQQLLSWTATALGTAFGNFDRALQCHRQVASRLDELVARTSQPAATGGRTEVLAERALSRMTHALVFAPTSTSSTLQEMLHLHLQEQFARVSWMDRQEQRQLRAAMREERAGDDDDDESEEESSDEDGEDEGEGGDTAVTGVPASKVAPEDLLPLTTSMGSVGIMPLCVETVTEMLFAQIQLKITKSAAKKFEARVLDTLRAWLVRVVQPWLSRILNAASPRQDGRPALFEQWRARLDFHLYETLAKLR